MKEVWFISALVAWFLCGLANEVQAGSPQISVIKSGDEWSYSDAGVAPAADWKLDSYPEDSWSEVWKKGFSSFGYYVSTAVPPTHTTAIASAGIVARTLLDYSVGNSQPSTKFVTTYFRKTFELSSADLYVITTSASWDDGMVIYINGVKIRQENMPAGSITNDTKAITAVNASGTLVPAVYVIAPGMVNPLKVGTNVIAVELHQSSITGTDAYFDLDMTLIPQEEAFGDVKIGAFQDFEEDLVLTAKNGINCAVYERDSSHRKLQYAIKYASSTGRWEPNVPAQADSAYWGDSRQVVFQRDTECTLVTERIDSRNHENLSASVQIRTEADPVVQWAAGDYVRGFILASSDGISYAEIPWFDFSGDGSTVSIELLSDVMPYFWLVPTILLAPANPVSNPVDWNALIPNTWTSPEAPPLSGGTSNYWRPGNLLETIVKGGAGFDRQITSGVDFTPYLDAGSSGQMQLELYNKETRLNLRIPFEMPVDPNSLKSINLWMRFDDGFGAWLASDRNAASLLGVKLAAEGEPLTDVSVPASRDDFTATSYKAFDITSQFKANARLGPGNVLCLRGYNAGKTSGDALLQAKIVGIALAKLPSTLNALELEGGDRGGMTTLSTPAGLIPSGTRSLKLKIVSRIAGSNSAAYPYVYVDNLQTNGVPKAALDLTSSLAIQLPAPAYGEEHRSPDGDPDHDGIVNLLEYAFGANPSVPAKTAAWGAASAMSIEPTISVLSDGRLAYQFRCLRGTLDASQFETSGFFTVNDLQYIPEVSTSGLQWTAKKFTFGYSADNGDGTQAVVLYTRTPGTSFGRQFCRIKVMTTRESWLHPLPTPGGESPFPEFF